MQWKGQDDMKMIPVEKLVFVEALFPRLRIDYSHVQRIVDAMEAGTVFPPIMIDQKHRIVDGNHRAKAIERILKGSGEVACVEKQYRNDDEFFLDAVRYNSEHGLSLSPEDRMHVMAIAEELKISASEISGALRMSVTAAGSLTTRPIKSEVAVRAPARPFIPKFRPRMPEPEVPPSQIVRSTARTSGRHKVLISDLIEWLEEGNIPVRDEWVMGRLRRMREILDAMDLSDQVAQPAGAA